MTPRQIEALRALYIQTGKTCDCWDLMGSQKAQTRARIMTDLIEAPKMVALSRAGVTAMETKFWSLFDVSAGECQADRQKIFREKAIAALTEAGRLP